MDKLINLLVHEFNKIDIKDLYDWDTPEDMMAFVDCRKTKYEQVVYLKENLFRTILGENLQEWDKDKYANLCFSVIRKWGGIKKFGSGDWEDARKLQFEDILTDLKNGTEIQLVDTIASLSKALAFSDCKKYAICDSRTILSLNYFIFKSETSYKMFSFLEGQGTRVKEAREKFEKICDYEKREKHKDTYGEYCTLLREIEKNHKITIQDMEMFLFSIANDKKNKVVDICKMIEDDFVLRQNS